MRLLTIVAVTAFLLPAPSPARAQAAGQPAGAQAAAGTAATGTDVYHVHFAKAASGQAEALAKALAQPDPSSPMPTHFVVLRHQEGDDWDFAVIQHLGKQATVSPAPTAPNPAQDLRAWHTDTFAAGPSWDEFTRQMGIGSGGPPAGSVVYLLSTYRALPGHRDALEKLLTQLPANSNIQRGDVVLQHLEGGNFQYVSLTRYNSWQDLASERASAASGSGWGDVRAHTAEHHDTITDRVYPR